MIDDFGSRLLYLIKARNLTQGEFAQGLGASPAFVSDMVRGIKKPGADFLSRLATQYHVSLDWLLLGHGTLDGASSIDGDWFRVVALRVKLAKLASQGNVEANLLVDELMGIAKATTIASPERKELLAYLAAASEESALINGLYNGFLSHPDPSARAREVMSAALVHFKSDISDPLAAMVSDRG